MPGGGGIAPLAGTVAWAGMYPSATDAVPPATTGAINAMGTYTTNPGFSPTGGLFYYVPQGGGMATAVAMNIRNGQIGALVNNNIVAATISPIPKGKYSVWLAVIYQDAAAPPNQTAIQSMIFNVEIK